MDLRKVLLARLNAVAGLAMQAEEIVEFGRLYGLLLRDVTETMNALRQLALAQSQWVAAHYPAEHQAAVDHFKREQMARAN